VKQFRLFVLTPFLALASMLALAGGIIYVSCMWFLAGDE
jgi:hypothetical protein